MATVVDCPTCGAKVEWTAANKYRPFCSERCRNEDLARWAEGRYRVSGEPAPDPDSYTDKE